MILRNIKCERTEETFNILIESDRNKHAISIALKDIKDCFFVMGDLDIEYAIKNHSNIESINVSYGYTQGDQYVYIYIDFLDDGEKDTIEVAEFILHSAYSCWSRTTAIIKSDLNEENNESIIPSK